MSPGLRISIHVGGASICYIRTNTCEKIGAVEKVSHPKLLYFIQSGYSCILPFGICYDFPIFLGGNNERL